MQRPPIPLDCLPAVPAVPRVSALCTASCSCLVQLAQFGSGRGLEKVLDHMFFLLFFSNMAGQPVSEHARLLVHIAVHCSHA